MIRHTERAWWGLSIMESLASHVILVLGFPLPSYYQIPFLLGCAVSKEISRSCQRANHMLRAEICLVRMVSVVALQTVLASASS